MCLWELPRMVEVNMCILSDLRFVIRCDLYLLGRVVAIVCQVMDISPVFECQVRSRAKF